MNCSNTFETVKISKKDNVLKIQYKHAIGLICFILTCGAYNNIQHEFFKFHKNSVNSYCFANHVMEILDMPKNDINVLINKLINYLRISSVSRSYFYYIICFVQAFCI